MNDAPDDVGEADDRRLDGNALTGALLELFAVDLVPAERTCAHCGRTARWPSTTSTPTAPPWCCGAWAAPAWCCATARPTASIGTRP